jgi:hypothetical protein
VADAAPAQDTHMLRVVGHGGTAVIGGILILAGFATFTSHLPMVLAVAQLIFGGAAIVLALASWRGSRMGWAFAMTLDGVLAVINLFGSVKIAHVAAIPVGLAGLPCIIAAVSCVLLAQLHADYDK